MRRRIKPRLFSLASEEWLEMKRPHLPPRSVRIEEANLKHLRPIFGGKLTTDIEPDDIARYQQKRLAEGASPKTVNLEVGMLRAILRKGRVWTAPQPDVKMLKTRDDVGRAISSDEERRLLEACLQSRSRSLCPAVVLALSTRMRYGELRLVQWEHLDLAHTVVKVSQSKTAYGKGREIPLNHRAQKVLTM